MKRYKIDRLIVQNIISISDKIKDVLSLNKLFSDQPPKQKAKEECFNIATVIRSLKEQIISMKGKRDIPKP
jgi:hypothetical protein